MNHPSHRLRRSFRALGLPMAAVLAFCMGAHRTVLALDANGDGLSDVFQRRYTLAAGSDAASRDSDGDGASDLKEFLFGTDPADALSVAPTKPRFDPTGVFVLKQLVPGALYGLETSTNLKTWTVAVAPVVANASTITFSVPPVPGERRFFRFFAPASQPDADGDGLNVIEERLLGTSDTEADTDHDGIADALEFANGTDPLDFFNGEAPAFVIVSGDLQTTPAGLWTQAPLVVEVRHSSSNAVWPLAPVKFASVSAGLGAAATDTGGGTFSITAGGNGRASVYAQMPSAPAADVPVTVTCGSASLVFHLVAGATNEPPSVNFTSPAPTASFDAGSAITFTLNAADADPGDTIAVSLYDRSTLLGTAAATGPGTYSFTWSSPVQGHRIVLAKAVDHYGNEAWAAVPVFVAAATSETQAFGPVEGGVAFEVAASADDLRSNPFVRQPAFVAAVGAVNGAVLTFNEQPSWTPAAFAGGYFVYVKSGAKTGALVPVAGNEANSLTLSTSAHGLTANDLIALIPKWSLDLMLPADSVTSNSRVFVAPRLAVPAMAGVSYQLGADHLWREFGGTDAVDIKMDPWSCFRVIHATGSPSTSFVALGDVAAGPLRFDLPAHAAAQDFAFGSAGPLAMSLRESGLADAGVVRDGASGVIDDVVTRQQGSVAQTWHLNKRAWTPDTGAGNGETAALVTGGAIIIHRSPAAAATSWIQPLGK